MVESSAPPRRGPPLQPRLGSPGPPPRPPTAPLRPCREQPARPGALCWPPACLAGSAGLSRQGGDRRPRRPCVRRSCAPTKATTSESCLSRCAGGRGRSSAIASSSGVSHLVQSRSPPPQWEDSPALGTLLGVCSQKAPCHPSSTPEAGGGDMPRRVGIESPGRSPCTGPAQPGNSAFILDARS